MYKLIANSSSIQRISDSASIPNDPANSDYAAYLKWLEDGNIPTPADVPSVAAIKAANIKKVDTDTDAIYAAAIGNRATEYNEAELQATKFKDADYIGTVPSYVESWLASNSKGLTTAQEAADDIIAQANAWRTAAASIRTNRLTAKKNIIDEVPTAMAQWNGFVTVIRGQLGL